MEPTQMLPKGVGLGGAAWLASVCAAGEGGAGEGGAGVTWRDLSFGGGGEEVEVGRGGGGRAEEGRLERARGLFDFCVALPVN